MSVIGRQWHRIFFHLRSLDWLMLFAVLTMIVLGLSAIYSVDLSRNADDLINVKKQIIALLIALSFVVAVAISNYRSSEYYSRHLYVAGVFLLTMVLFFGHSIRGVRGWFELGGFSFQPVEFMKVALVIILATYFSRKARRLFGWKELLISFGIALVPIILTLLQPDFGSASVLFGIWFVLAWLAGMPRKYIGILFIGGLVTLTIAWFGLFAPYQKARIQTFFQPTNDPLGQGYNVAQSIIAVGAGGWFGRGLGFGTQSQLKFLPESQTDFIFAVIAEELGFFGVILLFGVFTIFFLRVFRLVKMARDDFTVFLLLGLSVTIFIQVLVNIGMNLGLFPVTGVGLPFVSYGGSSLIFFLISFGLIQSVAIRSIPSTGTL